MLRKKLVIDLNQTGGNGTAMKTSRFFKVFVMVVPDCF